MGKWRLIGAATVAGVLLTATVAVAALPPGGTFIDDNGNTFEGAIEVIAAEGITRGCNPPANDRFCPDDLITRGQMAILFMRAFPYLDNDGGDLFVDDDGLVYEDAAGRLKKAGVTRGCNPAANDRYCGEGFVTRAQMAAFLARALGLHFAPESNFFVDDDDSIFERAIDEVAFQGTTQGCNPPEKDRFCPDDFVTRGQMAKLLARSASNNPIIPPPPATTTTT